MKLFKSWLKLNEANLAVPSSELRLISNKNITLTDIEKIFPLGEKVNFSRERLITAINYGMILEIGYQGKKDKRSDNTRFIYPLVYGLSKKNLSYIRGFHLKGFSVSENKETERVQRLFRVDSVKWLKFNGEFFRIEPEGYKEIDPFIVNVYKYAKFSEIAKNQDQLKKQKVVKDEKDLPKAEAGSTIIISDLEKTFDLVNPKEFFDDKSLAIEKFTFLQNQSTNEIIVVKGLLSNRKDSLKLMLNNKNIGNYKVLLSTLGSYIGPGKKTTIKGKSQFKMYNYEK